MDCRPCRFNQQNQLYFIFKEIYQNRNMNELPKIQSETGQSQTFDIQLEPSSVYCMRHRRQRALYICTDSKCNNSPFLCQKCFSDGLNRSYHYGHDEKIKGFSQGIKILSGFIKQQTNPVSKIFKSTLGRSEYANIVEKLEKGDFLYDQLNERIFSMKNQIELELDLLVKQFEKTLMLEKQEYFALLDNFQKTYIRNYDYLRTQTKALLAFQASIKYYGNDNNLAMKLFGQSRKKSNWIVQVKKTLAEITKKTETSGYITQMNELLAAANRRKIQMFPHWKTTQISGTQKERTNEFRKMIKRSISSWVFIPEQKILEEEMSHKNQDNNTTYKNTRIGSISKNYFSSSGNSNQKL